MYSLTVDGLSEIIHLHPSLPNFNFGLSPKTIARTALSLKAFFIPYPGPGIWAHFLILSSREHSDLIPCNFSLTSAYIQHTHTLKEK